MSTATLQRVVSVYPAYSGCAARLVFAVADGTRAITFTVLTGWRLPGRDHTEPMGSGIDYHDTKPHYENHKPSSDECEWTHAKCYSDGTSLGAADLLARMIVEGDAVVWAELEKHYTREFGVESALRCGGSKSHYDGG